MKLSEEDIIKIKEAEEDIKASLSAVSIPLSEVMEAMQSYDSKNYTYSIKNHCVSLLESEPLLAERVSEFLSKKGMRKFSYLNHGQYSLVFRTTDNQLVKLTAPGHHDEGTLECDEILKPILRETIGNISVAVYPELNTKDVTWEHVKTLKIRMAQKGYYCSDLGKSGVGLLPDGTPLIIDDGRILKCNKLDAHEKDVYDELRQQPKPLYEWKGKQERFFPKIGTDELVGVASDDTLHHMENGLDNEGVRYARIIRAEGDYHSDLLGRLGKGAYAMHKGAGAPTLIETLEVQQKKPPRGK